MVRKETLRSASLGVSRYSFTTFPNTFVRQTYAFLEHAQHCPQLWRNASPNNANTREVLKQKWTG